MDKKRLLFWSTFLGGAGLLAGYAEFGPAPEVGTVQPVAPRPAAPATVQADGGVLRPAPVPQQAASAPGTPLLAASAGALFAAQSWERKPPPPPPPPPTPPPPPPPPAAAPPMPFRFMGRLEEDGKVKVFLQNGERLHAASVGDVLEGHYRITRIDATQITFLYLPLEQPQVLAVGRPS